MGKSLCTKIKKCHYRKGIDRCVQLAQGAYGHFMTITRHKILVMEYCFKCGLIYQGLMHDWSKYSPAEFLEGAKYFSGKESPNNVERRDKGYSASWMHHKGRNRHHYEYWTDYDAAHKGHVVPVRMPTRYVIEMMCDRIAAGHVYNGENYRDSLPLEYFKRGAAPAAMHPATAALLERLLAMVAKKGEDYTFEYVRKKYVLPRGKRLLKLKM